VKQPAGAGNPESAVGEDHTQLHSERPGRQAQRNTPVAAPSSRNNSGPWNVSRIADNEVIIFKLERGKLSFRVPRTGDSGGMAVPWEDLDGAEGAEGRRQELVAQLMMAKKISPCIPAPPPNWLRVASNSHNPPNATATMATIHRHNHDPRPREATINSRWTMGRLTMTLRARTD